MRNKRRERSLTSLSEAAKPKPPLNKQLFFCTIVCLLLLITVASYGGWHLHYEITHDDYGWTYDEYVYWETRGKRYGYIAKKFDYVNGEAGIITKEKGREHIRQFFFHFHLTK